MSFGIISHADGFRKVALRCNEQRQVDNFTIEWLPIQGTINAAFACELYLKSILKSKKGYTNNQLRKLKHNLNDIYSELPDEIKSKLERSVDTSKLLDISNAFVNWRYLYEDIQSKMHDDNKFICELMDLLYEITRSYCDVR